MNIVSKYYQNPAVVDLEGDSLNPTKFHCMGWYDFKHPEVQYTTDPKVIAEKLASFDCVIGHNFWMWDQIHVKRLLSQYGYEFNYSVIDTLALSNYIRPIRLEHSLESYQEEVKVLKVAVTDWENAEEGLYIDRVVGDVKLNTNLLFKFLKNFRDLYGEEDGIQHTVIRFLSFLYEVYHYSNYNPFKLDRVRLAEYTKILEDKLEIAKTALMSQMPNVMKTVYKPAKMYKKDGTISEAGKKWYLLLEENGANLDVEEVEVIKAPPNPSSADQVKDWLLTLGWEPDYYKDGANGRVPQIKNKDGELCRSIENLENPSANYLREYSVLKHRLSQYLHKFDQEHDTHIAANIKGLTNTLRKKHRDLVNLPKVTVPYGDYIRGVLTCEDDEVVIGSDLSSLENYTRTNFVCEIDPKAAEELLDPDFDTHLATAVSASLLTQDDVDWFIAAKKVAKDGGVKYGGDQERYEKIEAIRGQAKTTGYSALYNVGAAKLARELGISLNAAKRLLEGFWLKNYAVKLFSKACKVKTVGDSKWVLNPLNKFWYPLRSDKDIFSVVNQSAGAFIFDLWIKEIRLGIQTSSHQIEKREITAQFHDEIAIIVKEKDKEIYKEIIQNALVRVNEKLKLKIHIKCEVKVGKYYSEVH